MAFTLSLPVTAAIPPGEEELFRLALDLARDYQPITKKQANEIQVLAAGVEPIFGKTKD
jgi:hypothetical protein